MTTAFRNFKRIIAVLAIVCLTFALMPANTLAFQATDISGHWAQVKIQSWIDKGLIKGYPDGTFKPDQDITRAEFMALVNRAFGYTAVAPITYTDVKAGSWYAPEVAKAQAAGYISGYPDGTMKPENPITREEVATIVARIKNLTSDANAADKYTDAAKIGSWSKGQVGAVTSAKIMQGYPDGSFMPQGLMTRAEVVVALDNALHYTAPVVVTPPVVTPPVVTYPGNTYPVTTYPVTFTVADAMYVPVQASITIASQTVATNVYGRATINLGNGTYLYGVTATGYDATSGSAIVAGAAVAVPVTMTATAAPTYAVTLGTITKIEGDDESTVTIATSPAVAGATVTLTVAPKMGMQLKADTLVANYNDGSAKVAALAGTGPYTFTMPAYAVSVTAEFEEIPAYAVTFTVTNGTGPIVGAEITINETTLTTDGSGVATFSNLGDGTYAYGVTALGFNDITGSSVTVAGAAVAVPVTMTAMTAPATDDTLSALTSSVGTLSPTFDAATLTYSVVLPAGTTIVPTVTATATDSNATAVVTQATSVTGSATVLVTAQDGTTNQTYTITFTVAAALGSDATLKASSTVKGVTLLSLGRSSASGDIWSDGGTVTITAAEAANTTNLTSYITLFDPTDARATVKVVKYPQWTNNGTFDSDSAYANQAITNQDYFWVKVTAPDTTTLYYKVNVTVTPAPVTNEAQLRAALANTHITTISLGANIALTSPLTISRTVTIDGLENSISGKTITISAGTVTLKNMTLTGTENLQTGDGNYGIMVQGGSLVADNINMTVATENADNNVGFNVASGANLDLRNSTITITDAGGDQQQYAVYAQSGAGTVILTDNTFSFNAGNASGHYSYLIGMQGDAVANYPNVTLTGTNTNNAYMKLLLVGADTLANKEAYAVAGNRVAVGERLGIMGADQGIYLRTATGWTL